MGGLLRKCDDKNRHPFYRDSPKIWSDLLVIGLQKTKYPESSFPNSLQVPQFCSWWREIVPWRNEKASVIVQRQY